MLVLPLNKVVTIVFVRYHFYRRQIVVFTRARSASHDTIGIQRHIELCFFEHSRKGGVAFHRKFTFLAKWGIVAPMVEYIAVVGHRHYLLLRFVRIFAITRYRTHVWFLGCGSYLEFVRFEQRRERCVMLDVEREFRAFAGGIVLFPAIEIVTIQRIGLNGNQVLIFVIATTGNFTHRAIAGEFHLHGLAAEQGFQFDIALYFHRACRAPNIGIEPTHKFVAIMRNGFDRHFFAKQIGARPIEIADIHVRNSVFVVGHGSNGVRNFREPSHQLFIFFDMNRITRIGCSICPAYKLVTRSRYGGNGRIGFVRVLTHADECAGAFGVSLGRNRILMPFERRIERGIWSPWR